MYLWMYDYCLEEEEEGSTFSGFLEPHITSQMQDQATAR